MSGFTFGVFVRNIPFNATDGDLEEHFTFYGDVVSVKILTDGATGRSRGCGFVNFATRAEQSLAVDNGNESIMLGRKLDVREAEDRRPVNVTQDWKKRQAVDYE
jgi:RNA recognition motif-containing protein